MHSFVATTLRQTGQIVTLEQVLPLRLAPLQEVDVCSLSVEAWLKLIRTQIPCLTWTIHPKGIHVLVTQTILRRNPLDDKFSTDFTDKKSIEDWFKWVSEKFPSDELYSSEEVYTRLGLPIFPQLSSHQSTIGIHVTKGETIREFLADFAKGYNGTWIATLEDLSSRTVASHYSSTGELVYGHIKTTTIYCVQ